MTIHELCFKGEADAVKKLLDQDPGLLDQRITFSNPSGKSLELAPIFAAAIGGQPEVVKALLDRKARPSFEGSDEDLFTWSCLCPNQAKRSEIRDLIFQPEYRPLISEQLTEAYQAPFNDSLIDSIDDSDYPLSPSDVTVLMGAPQVKCGKKSRFREMTPYELDTYRLAVFRILGENGYDFPPHAQIDRKLHIAVQLEDLPMLEEITKETNLSSEVLPSGPSIASFAAVHGKVESLKFLRNKYGPDILNQPIASGPWQGCTLVHLTAAYNLVNVLNYLKEECGIEALTQPSASGTWQGFTPAHLAARSGQVDALKCLNEECQVDLNQPNASGAAQGYTLAHLAAKYGQVNALKYLKEECQVDLNQPIASGSWQGYTPAYLAVRFGQVDALKYLKEECQVELNQPIISGRWQDFTPAHLAVRFGQVDALKYLKEECQVDLNQPIASGPMQGKTPAHLAAEYNQVNVLKYLQECGIDLNQPIAFGQNQGRTPAHFAANNLAVDVLKFLAFDPTDVTLINLPLPKLTPLQLAALLKQEEGIQTLFASGASMEGKVQDATGKEWDVVDFTLVGNEESRLGPLTEKEEKTSSILRLFMENGLDRDVLLDRLQESHPRLYHGLLSTCEKTLIAILRHQSRLKKILANELTIPENSRFIWQQGSVAREIRSEDLQEAFSGVILGLLGKMQISKVPIHRPLKAKLHQIAQTDPKGLGPIPMNPEKIMRTAQLLQRLEQASHELGATVYEERSEFAAHAPPTVRWEPARDLP